MLNLGIFTSLKDQEALDLLYGILGAVDSGYLSGVGVKYVFCDRPEMANSSMKEKLKKHHVALFLKSSRDLRRLILENKPVLENARGEFDRGVFEIIRSHKVDYVLLAGYMLIVSPFLCGKLKMLNLHPDLPGRLIGTWQDIMWQITARDYNSAGAMIHLVTPELDKGPALSYFAFSVREPDPEKIRQEEFRRELPLILLTLKALAGKEITVRKGIVYIAGKKEAHDFSGEVDDFKY